MMPQIMAGIQNTNENGKNKIKGEKSDIATKIAAINAKIMIDAMTHPLFAVLYLLTTTELPFCFGCCLVSFETELFTTIDVGISWLGGIEAPMLLVDLEVSLYSTGVATVAITGTSTSIDMDSFEL